VNLPSVSQRISSSDQRSLQGGFQKSFIKTQKFTLTSYHRITRLGQPLSIYIEGDGLSWVSRTQLSTDPTPLEPLVLELAILDRADNVAYIARPGQYSSTGKPDCSSSYWSNKRFSKEVIESMNEAISQLASQAGTKIIQLIGYSGGAAVAVLIAARRHDIASLKTIAGNLDPQAVNRYHNVSPLDGSLNPMDVAEKIMNIPQCHFVGSKDTMIPLWIVQSFVRKEGNQDDRSIRIIKGCSHIKGWQQHWDELQNKS